MSDTVKLGPWVRRFLVEHLVTERNLARNTQLSYRDGLAGLIPFIAHDHRKSVEALEVIDVTAERVKQYLCYLERERNCSVSTRNQRLAALHAFARFIGERSPEHLEWTGQIRSIPFKKTVKAQVTYLEKSEMEALLGEPNLELPQGRRDYALLLFLYNTGARADEAAALTITDLYLAPSSHKEHSFARILGKGRRVRQCPLWSRTVNELKPLIANRGDDEHVFLNRCGRPITRFGIHTLVERYVQRAAERTPSLKAKRISPHSIRHTTATHLLRAGVDINTIRAWLGHVSLNTTHIYAEIDLEMKARALAQCEVSDGTGRRHWRNDKGVMAFLRSL